MTATALEMAGLLAATLLAAVAMLRRSTRDGALAMLGAVAASGGLLLSELSGSAQLEAITGRPLLAGAGGLIGLAALAAAAVVVVRRPAVLAVAAVTAMCFRIPVPLGGETANLLVPLYAVIGAGVLAHAGRVLRGGAVEPGRRAPGALEWMLAAAIVLYALQAAYSSDVSQAVRNVVFFYVPFALLLALLADVEWTPRLLRTCLVVLAGLALLFCAVGVVQYIAQDVFINDRLARSNAYNPHFRANSLFYDPNIFGRYVVVVMLLLAAALAAARGRRAVGVGAVVLALLWLGLATSLSSSSFAALLAGLAVLAALLGYARPVAYALGAVVVAGLVIVLVFPSAIGLDPDSAGSIRKATSGRDRLVGGAVDLFTGRPVAGRGSGSFAQEYRALESTGRPREVSASHTIPLTVAVEQGVAGLVVYLGLLAAAFRLLLREGRRSLPDAAIAAAFAALFVHTLSYAAFLEDPLTWVLLAAGMAWRAGRGSDDPTCQPARPPQPRHAPSVLTS